MSKESYSVPKGPNDCFNFQRDAITLCTANALAWGIPNEKIASITVLRVRYEEKYAIANNQSTQSPSATAARNDAWDKLEPELIYIYDHYLINNESILIADKEALHINLNENTSGGPAEAPTTVPVVVLSSEGVSTLNVIYSDSATPGTHSKPNNVAFCELCCKVGDPAPASIDECTTRFNISRSHQPIVFQPDQRGKTIYAYPRWVNKNGKIGSWGNRVSTIIP
jgi:hypothetical protein